MDIVGFRTWAHGGPAAYARVREVTRAALGRAAAPSPGGEVRVPPKPAHLLALLAALPTVPVDLLPPLPPGWPRSAARGSFRYRAAALADAELRRAYDTDRPLFAALGLPARPMGRLARALPAPRPRPYSLLHSGLDLDTAYLDGRGLAFTEDWSGAGFGDPLYDVACHLTRCGGDAHDVLGRWVLAVEQERPAATAGAEHDLRHYTAFLRGYAVVGALAATVDAVGPGSDLGQAARKVRESLAELDRLTGPLGLRQPVAGLRALERVLRREAVRRGGWEPDARVPLSQDFPEGAVAAALEAERDEGRRRVLSGTAHRNSVVRLPAYGRTVVVRRFAPSRTVRRERGFYSEHTVLRAIHESTASASGPRVPRVPRVLALGSGGHVGGGGEFAIHSYEGAEATPGPVEALPLPAHPVDGLTRAEADGLVDQFAALARVDCRALDPLPEQPDFHAWLCAELVRLVDSLPAPSRERAARLGLPDAAALDAVLRVRTVTRRTPGLLHGDLNPWNLVRVPGGLAIIDWELAMIGDPLYDLVRHLHLTPAPQPSRAHMYARWSRRLPGDRTRGWREDREVYGRIEVIRSAYVDLDHIVMGTALDVPNVRRAVEAHARTVTRARTALAWLADPRDAVPLTPSAS